ncbi:F-box/WD repeat-containing protein 5-like [Teleopsis dalmanni]|uniref:F-box/WD repeat-containing protein 5-like n=1 Tax=Teleopsis dalmanni TaxID=139649 RepID=UPI0018CC848D|nr:F-box/WD repeat-containing protein 5-like [Teleopsis dalmanni]
MTTNTSSTSLQEMDTNPIAEELEQDFLESKWWTIPHHILHSIFYSLPVKDVVSASGVCRRWREIASDELLWKKKMHRHFKIDPTLPLKPGAESWRSEYVRLACEIPFIQTQSIRGHAHQVLHVSFSHDGDMFATCSKDGYVIVWNSDHPCREKYAHNMKEFNWKYTQFSQFNQSDTLLMVSGVHFGSPHSTSGEIAVFTVYGKSHLRCRVVNRPYDIFGTWFSDQYLIAGDLIWLAHLVSTSRLLLNKANQETASEHVPITCELFKFLNLSASSVRAIMIARCPWLNDENDPLPPEGKQCKESATDDEVPTTSNGVHNSQEQPKTYKIEGLPDVAQQSTSNPNVDSATIRYAEAYLKNIKFNNDYELTSSDDDDQVVGNSNDVNIPVEDSDMENDIDLQEQTQLNHDDEDDDNEDMSSDEMENHIPKYLIFSMGSKTYTPHQIGIKRIRNVNFPKRLDPGLPLRERLAARRAAQREVRPEPAISAVQNFNTPDKIIDLHGHIVGMALSPDHRFVYIVYMYFFM